MRENGIKRTIWHVPIDDVLITLVFQTTLIGRN